MTTPFEIPRSFLEKLYELTGDGKNNKGFLLFYIGNDGTVRQCITRQSEATFCALRKRAETFLAKLDESEIVGSESEEDE
jgi:hypothetical protein